MSTWKRQGSNIYVRLQEEFSLADTLQSGQTFRWKPFEKGFLGMASDRICYAEQREDLLILHDAAEKDADFWINYFDFNRDYTAIKNTLPCDRYLAEALKTCGGIRLLRQDFWETVISFILSANNNIPRISGTIEKLCAAYGNLVGERYGRAFYAFPEPEVLAAAKIEDLRALGTGYRDIYIKQTAELFAQGKFGIQSVEGLNHQEARKKLMELPGVGAKVAECILLFGAGVDDAFPIDTWVRKVVCGLYLGEDDPKQVPVRKIEDFAREHFPQYAGFAQQVLFHYMRSYA